MTANPILFANNATTTLASAISNSATSVAVASGTGVKFPSPGAGQFFIMTFLDAATQLIEEIVHVTAVSGDTMTIIRAQEGTSALAWNAGDIAAMLITAGTSQAFVQALQLQQQAGNFAAAGGTANAITATLSPIPPNLAALAGAPIRVQASATNTGAVTLNVNGLGAEAVVHADGTPLIAGDIPSGTIFAVVFNGSASFFLQSQPSAYGASAIQLQAGNYAAAGGSANVLTVALTPIPASQAALAGVPVRFQATASNTGAVTLNVNALGAHSVVHPDGSALVANDILNTSIYEAIWNGGGYILQTPTVAYLDTLFDTAGAAAAAQTAAETYANGTASFGVTGSIVLPGGYIRYWGFGTTSGGGTLAVTLPSPFPNAYYGYAAYPTNAGGGALGAAYSASTNTVTSAGFNIETFQGASHSSVDVYWEAWGH